jgi:hypothetical protein
VITVVVAALSVAAGARFGHEERPRSTRSWIGRGLTALVGGALLGGAAMLTALLLSAWLGWSGYDAEVTSIVSAGVVLLAVAGATRRRGPAQPDAEPAIAAEECERSVPAVEIALLWGGELLRVVHLDPPRSFALGDGSGDLLVDGETLAAGKVPIVAVGADGVRVLPPPGATCVPLGARGALAEGVPIGRSMTLEQGARVRLTLPSRAARTTYRETGAHGQAPPSAPLVLEIGLVRAGRVVGRSFAFEKGTARLVAFTSIAAACVTACLGVGEYNRAIEIATDPLEYSTSNDDQYEIQRGLLAAAERQHEDVDEGTSDLPCYQGLRPDWDCLERHHPERRSPRTVWPTSRFTILDVCSFTRAAPDTSDLFGSMCGGDWRQAADDEIDTPTSRTLRAMVHIGVPTVTGALSPEVVRRVVRASTARFRRCYDLGLGDGPRFASSYTIRFVIGADGRTSRVEVGPPLVPDPTVAACVVHELSRMEFPRPERAVTNAALSIDFYPHK